MSNFFILRPNRSDIFRRVIECLHDLDQSRSWDIKISEHQPEHTHEQRGYYHGVVVKLIAEHTGYTHSETHEMLLLEYSTTVVVPLINGKWIERAKRSSEMNRREYAEYTEECRAGASLHWGLVIPDPDPEKRAA